MANFDEWWEKYCRVSSLNKRYLSFLDVDILKEELKLAYYHKLPEPPPVELNKERRKI